MERSGFSFAARVLITGWLACAAGSSLAQDFPTRPIRFIVPYDPGGNTTILARIAGERMAQSLGQQVLVDNRPGGNTVIGSELMVRAAPDGHTILLVTSTHVISPILNPKLPYDSVKDFAPVATLARTDLILAGSNTLPANNLQELVALAKAKPGALNAASTGTGGITHLASEYFNIVTGIKTQHVPYKGTGLVLTDMVGGQVQLFFAPPAALIPFIKAGKLKGLAVTTENRMTALPGVPTFAEAGVPAYDLKSWYGVLAPAATPRRLIDRLSGEIGKTLALPEVRKTMVAQDMDPFISTPDQFATLMTAESAKFARIIKTAGIKLSD
jgi:tripartite-type tricarboxylate transporter receptor subunit TctC